MKLTAAFKLQPSEAQAQALYATLEHANAACNMASDVAWQTRTFGQFALQKLIYHELKARFRLTAQMAVRAVAKVADAYKLDKKTVRTFRPHGAIAYDDRIIRFIWPDAVNLWTVDGRQTIPFVCGEHQRALLLYRKGEVDLLVRRGVFFLNAVCDVPEDSPLLTDDVLGIVNLAADSDGVTYSGAMVDRIRRTYAHRRRNLQRKQTRAAKRKLRQLKGRQRRFQRNVNHVLSKQIVQVAQRTGRAIALEDLSGIRNRVTARRSQRARLHNWGFFQLRQFIAYKAQRAGVPVVFVDPKNTSRTCSQCGCIDKANRKSQAEFLCIACGYAAPADSNAARITRAKAAVMPPMAALAEPVATSRLL